MKRTYHVLSPNTKSEKISDLIFFDCETFVHDTPTETLLPLRLGVALYLRRESGRVTRRKDTVFYSSSEFADFIESCVHGNCTIHMISHNVQFDLAVSSILHTLSARGWRIVFIYTKAGTTIIRLKRKNAVLIFEDGLNRLRGSIKQWGELLSLPKLPQPDFNNDPDHAIIEYCRRDVEILAQAHLQFFDFIAQHNLGSEKNTLASQAFTAYRHRFMKTPIHIHNNQTALELERRSYAGGLVRVWKRGTFSDDTYYHVDVNSMYPYVMRDNPYPTRLLKIEENISPKRLADLCKHFLVIADVTIKPTQPFFFRKTSRGNIYPLYTFRSVYCTPEIRLAYEYAEILRVHRVAIYEHDIIFHDYVTFFHNLRRKFLEESNPIYAQIAKMLLNSLYGKFGSTKESLIETDEFSLPGLNPSIVTLPDRKTVHIYYLGSQAFTTVQDGETFNSFPGIAGHVTSYARCYLVSLILRAGIENVYYTDTDSLIVNQTGFDRLASLIHPTQLGRLKLQETAQTVTIYARKDYVFGQTTKRKGLNPNARQINDTTFVREVWPGIRTWSKNPTPQVYSIKRQIYKPQRVIYDGIVQPDGTVTPLTSPPDFDPDPLELFAK